VRYEHQIVQAAIVHPGKRQVIPLAPEEVKNSDGTDKQDCEINAGKRLIKKIRQSHPKLPLIIVTDSLQSKQPFIEGLKEEDMRYVLVAKPEDHKILMEWVNEQRQPAEISRLEMIRAGREPLVDAVEVDDCFIRGEEEGVSGRGPLKRARLWLLSKFPAHYEKR
jgi:hypothetical protein